jgi:hypothetical protein
MKPNYLNLNSQQLAYLMGFLKLYFFNVSYNLFHFFLLLQKLSQTWLSKRISEKKKNKLKKEKADLFLET